MELVNVHLETGQVAKLADFYCQLIETDVTLNDYYVEVPTSCGVVTFSKPRAAGTPDIGPTDPCGTVVVLEFQVDNVDDQYSRINALGVEWVLPPTTQPWGNRLMMFRDPCGNLIALFSRPDNSDAAP
jgi:predicted enzyme related to lactoylglutathione lyase